MHDKAKMLEEEILREIEKIKVDGFKTDGFKTNGFKVRSFDTGSFGNVRKSVDPEKLKKLKKAKKAGAVAAAGVAGAIMGAKMLYDRHKKKKKENETKKESTFISSTMVDYLQEKTELYENAGAAAAGVVTGAAAGLASSHFATKKNQKLLARLLAAKKQCGDNDDCKERYDQKIKELRSKINNSDGSKVRRAVGGVVTSALGVGIYHAIDSSSKKKRYIKNVINKLRKQLKSCSDDKCRERVNKQIAALKNKD